MKIRSTFWYLSFVLVLCGFYLPTNASAMRRGFLLGSNTPKQVVKVPSEEQQKDDSEEPVSQENNIDNISEEMLLHIFCFLDKDTIVALRHVSKKFARIAADDTFQMGTDIKSKHDLIAYAKHDTLRNCHLTGVRLFREATNEDLELLTKANPDVTHLDLGRCPHIRDLNTLKSLPKLKKLILRFKYHDRASLEAYMAQRLGNPGEENIHRTAIYLANGFSSHDLNPLSELEHLKYLTLSMCVDLLDLNPLQCLSNLTHLDLKQCDDLSSLNGIGHLAELRSLKVEIESHLGTRKKLTDINSLGSLAKLEVLELCNCSRLEDLSVLTRLPSLKHLKLQRCKKLLNLDTLKNISTLVSLNLRECREFSNLMPLADLKNLRDLYLDTPAKGANTMKQCQNLIIVNPTLKIHFPGKSPLDITALGTQNLED